MVDEAATNEHVYLYVGSLGIPMLRWAVTRLRERYDIFTYGTQVKERRKVRECMYLARQST